MSSKAPKPVGVYFGKTVKMGTRNPNSNTQGVAGKNRNKSYKGLTN